MKYNPIIMWGQKADSLAQNWLSVQTFGISIKFTEHENFFSQSILGWCKKFWGSYWVTNMFHICTKRRNLKNYKYISIIEMKHDSKFDGGLESPPQVIHYPLKSNGKFTAIFMI